MYLKPQICKTQPSTKSESAIPAPIIKQCDHGYGQDKGIKVIEDLLNQLKINGGLYYTILLLQYRGALRISEVLNLDYTSFISDDTVYVKGLKGSDNKILHVPELRGFIVKWRKYKVKPFLLISRFSVYRFYKRIGLSYPKVKGTKSNVTHSVRNIVIRNMRRNNIPDKEISGIIGHKSKNSLQYYG